MKPNLIDIIIPLFESKKYNSLPDSFNKYCEKIISKLQLENPLYIALNDDVVGTLQAINRMFHRASTITGLDPYEVFMRTDIGENDFSPERIESSFAEIRAIIHLDYEGFNNITPLISKRKIQEADIIGEKNEFNFAIEVVVSPQNAKNKSSSDKIIRWILGKLKNDVKVNQLRKTAEKLIKPRLLIVCVINTVSAKWHYTYEEYILMCKTVWDNLEKNENFHVSIVTGDESNNKLDDCVYPEWPR